MLTYSLFDTGYIHLIIKVADSVEKVFRLQNEKYLSGFILYYKVQCGSEMWRILDFVIEPPYKMPQAMGLKQ